jgi:hypothetical protein
LEILKDDELATQQAERKIKGLSPWASNLRRYEEPAPVTLPKIDPNKHKAAFKAAMDLVSG